MRKTFILLFQCRDRKGIVAKISEFVLKNSGSIITADQHSTDVDGGSFFMRLEFFVEMNLENSQLERGLKKLAAEFKAKFSLFDKEKKLRMGIMASRPDHCLFDLLYLWRSNELGVQIPFVISNYEKNNALADQFRAPFYYVPANKKSRREKEILSLVRGKSDFLVLARYMLVLSKKFLKNYSKDIINIHHGFLPSFKGKDPYEQALKEGVKVIGATAHFVTEKLDNGPIITQKVEHVSHRQDLASFIRKGKNLEKYALSDAVSAYADHRIIRHGNKTIVF